LFKQLFFWLIAVALHRFKDKITLIPLYAYLAILTVLTHNLSDLGFSIVTSSWFFLISSFSFFTTLMFVVLFLYLFEGPRAGRLALWTILGSSFFYIVIVILLGFEVNTTNWVQFNLVRAPYYFWSILAIIFDVIFIGIVWELLSKIKSLNLVIRVFLITFGVLALDTFIFTTGVYGASGVYLSALKGDLFIRLILSLIGAPIIGYFLKSEGFSEEKRDKPKNFWEILNFRSDLEKKIFTLEEIIEKNKILEQKIRKSEEAYELALSGSGSGIWDWDTITNSIVWSSKFCELLGYEPGGIKGDLTTFKNILLHPDDIDRTFVLVNQCLKTGKPYEIEYRLKTKLGEYRWFLATGITKYDNNKKPIRMVGSIIDINAKKQAELTIKEQLDQLTKLNNLLIDREIKMVELKKEISDLKK